MQQRTPAPPRRPHQIEPVATERHHASTQRAKPVIYANLQHHHRTTRSFILAEKRCWSKDTVSHHVLHQYREELAAAA